MDFSYCMYTYILYVHVYLVCTCISCMYMYILYVHVYLVCTCISCMYTYILYVHVYLVCTCISCMYTFILYVHIHISILHNIGESGTYVRTVCKTSSLRCVICTCLLYTTSRNLYTCTYIRIVCLVLYNVVNLVRACTYVQYYIVKLLHSYMCVCTYLCMW